MGPLQGGPGCAGFDVSGCSNDPSSEPRYTGKELEPDLDLYYFGARYLDAGVGRFTTPDPGSFTLENPQTLNRYAYAANSPFRYSDPNGREIVVQSHLVSSVGGGPRALPYQHLSLRIEPEDQARYEAHPDFQNINEETNRHFATLGAGPVVGKLVSRFGRRKDLDLSTKKQVIRLDLGDQDENEVIEKLFAAEKAYKDDLRYGLFPRLPDIVKKYNSNSYVSGILIAVGIEPPQVDASVPGYNEPVPAIEFQPAE